MGTDFTGTDAWVGTLTGPANTNDLSAESCTDMGVQLANRTMWLSARIDDSHQWRHVDRIDVADPTSAYGDVATVTSLTWDAMAAYFHATLALGSLAGLLRITFEGTIQNTNTGEGEVRLTAGGSIASPDDISTHARIEVAEIASVSLELITAIDTPISGDVDDVGLIARANEIDGAVKAIGSGRLDIWKLTKVAVP
jgi:hypothetical protein